jgi:predicted nucleic acid-binding protein
MATSPDRVCWDACSWIALIQDERIVEDGIERATRCKTVLEQAKKRKIEVVTSALCLAEVCKIKDVAASEPVTLADFFEHEFILLIALDRRVGELARELMMRGLPGLKPPDACHLATAAITPGVRELHSFDERLLKLTNKVQKADGGLLRVCFPDAGGPTPPLLRVSDNPRT